MDDLKKLAKLIKLCRKEGIQSIRFDGVELHLNELPQKIDYKKYPDLQPLPSNVIAPGGITEDIQIPTDGLTEDQLLYYSAVPQGEQQ